MTRSRLSYHFYFVVSVAVLVVPLIIHRHASLPGLDEFITRPVSVELLDRHDRTISITALSDGTRRQHLPYADLPAEARRVFQTAEDRRFFVHPGVDPLALIRAVFQRVSARNSVSGASTITMQLARMIESQSGHDDKPRWKRKIREIFLALRIEGNLGKERIFELWINNLPFGFQAEGIAAASRLYFNKDVVELSPAQLLMLAVTPRNPSLYNPITSPERSFERAVKLAAKYHPGLRPPETAWGQWPNGVPHFTNMVLNSTAGEYLSGTIVTSLDLDLQRLLENRIQVHLDRTSESRIQNGAGLLVKTSTGEIIAYVGSQDFYQADTGGQIDGVRIVNQPGSTIKPFLYALALELGYSPNTVLADLPTSFGSEAVYVPRNFDDRYHGPVRLSTALASSLNVPATALLEEIGVRRFTGFLLDFGFDSISTDLRGGYPKSGLGIALGNTPVSLYELVRGFSVFPRSGAYLDLTWRMVSHSATDQRRHRAEKTIISAETAKTIQDILSDPSERVVGFGVDDPFYTGFQMMIKTGTASRYQSIWALASAGDYTIGVWLGNFNGSTVIGRTGSSLPARIALEVLASIVEKGLDFEDAPLAGARVERAAICVISGGAATEYCPATREELFTISAKPGPCSFHSRRNHEISYPSTYLPWIAGYGKSGTVDSVHSALLEIVTPVDGAVFFYDPGLSESTQKLRVDVVHDPELPANLSVNGRATTAPIEIRPGFTSWFVPLERGVLHVKVHSGAEFFERSVVVK